MEEDRLVIRTNINSIREELNGGSKTELLMTESQNEYYTEEMRQKL